MKNLFLYKTETNNPYYNLALEDYFVEYVSKEKNEVCFLYFWQNADSIILGRNQDAVSECRLDVLQQTKAFLARRKSGGGAVFHDSNNLNFSFVVPKSLFNKKKSMEIIKKAFENLGIDAELSGRNDVLVNGRKFSGNAYLNTKDISLHHGTILIDTNVEKMQLLLNVDKLKLQSKGVKSVKSRVINLKEVKPNISIAEIEKAITNEFEKCYKGSMMPFMFDESSKQIISKKEKFYSNKEWILGKFTSWSDFIQRRLTFGNCTLKWVELENKSKLYKIYSDALDTDFIQKAEDYLNGLCRKKDFSQKNQKLLLEIINIL